MILTKLRKNIPFALMLFVLGVFFVVQLSCLFKESRTFDEILHLEAGTAFLKNKDFTIEPFNPPLAREIVALPVIFKTETLNDPFLFWPRFITIVFSLLLSILVFYWSKIYFGTWPAFFSLIILILTPEVLAHSHYANTDLISTFFAFASLFLFDRFFLSNENFLKKNKIKAWRYAVLGFLIGLSLAAKTTAIFFVVLPIGIFAWKKRKIFNKKLVFFSFLVCTITVWATYFFTFEPALGYRNDENRQANVLIQKYPFLSFLIKTKIPLGSFLGTIKQDILSNQTNKFPKDTFFAGKLSQGVSGVFLWLVFLIKTPLPIIILLIKIFFSRENISGVKFLKFSLIFIFLEMIFLGSNLRLRYFLIVYPAIAVLSAGAIKIILQNHQLKNRIFIGIFLVWLMFGAIKTFPHFLTFSNEIFGSSGDTYKYVVDSNLDWGQGLPTLKKYLDEKNIKEVQLAYFGNVEPSIYGLSYLRMKDANLRGEKEIMSLNTQKPLVVSASCWYYCGYYQMVNLASVKPKILSGQFLLFNFKP